MFVLDCSFVVIGDFYVMLLLGWLGFVDVCLL